MPIEELSNNADKALMAERMAQRVFHAARLLMPAGDYLLLQGAEYILSEVRIAAYLADDTPREGQTREQQKAEILDRLWRNLITDCNDED